MSWTDTLIWKPHAFESRMRAALELLRRTWRTPGSVIDLGCGHEDLRAMFPSSTRYLGVDCIVPPRAGVLCADLSEGVPSGLPDFDLAMALGLVEHLADPGPLLRTLPAVAATLLASYNRQHCRFRRAWDWFEATTEAHGWRPVASCMDPGCDATRLYLLAHGEGRG